MKNGLFDKNRLEYFSDAVMAIIITIMVIEFHAPEGTELSDLAPLAPIFLAYILSFIYIAIYWNNHHHLLKAAKGVNGKIQWSNMSLLFFLSLIPFFTTWMGENPQASVPTAAYGAVLLGASLTYFNLQRNIFKTLGKKSQYVQAVGQDYKGKLSPVFYSIGIVFAFIAPIISQIIFILVAFMWIIPDKRIEETALEN